MAPLLPQSRRPARGRRSANAKPTPHPKWSKWLAGRENASKAAALSAGSTSEWERYRRKYPQLRLRSFGDDRLKHFLMGLDARLSLQFFNMHQRAATSSHAARALTKFFEHNRQTWRASGWVTTAVAAIVLADRESATYFVKKYWVLAGATAPPQQLKAWGALAEFDPERKTWLKMAKAVLSAYDPDDYNRRALESRAIRKRCFPQDFAVRDLSGIDEELLDRGCRLLAALSKACIQERPSSATKLLDYAIAELHKTSLSTLQKLRAKMKK